MHPLTNILFLSSFHTFVGGCVAEQAADRLYETQKANAATLLKMIKEYSPQGSGVVWGKLTLKLPLQSRLNPTLNLI